MRKGAAEIAEKKESPEAQNCGFYKRNLKKNSVNSVCSVAKFCPK
jgi:hypothetical protein